MKMSVEVEIGAVKEKVWAAITDIENCEKMITGIVGLKVIDKPESGVVGLKWSETRVMFGKEAEETMWITDAVENEYYCTRAESHGSIYATKLSLQENNNVTVLSMTFTGTSDSAFVRMLTVVMGLFMKKSMIKMLQADLEDIKRFVEAH
ncbi:MAG: SRPBCC family protein [Kangiellaceae bacterium]|nr:SRPBCC family protein [Kangiellaceae bacterium]